jgi:hypothetical protein
MSFVRQAFGIDPRTFGRRFDDAPEWPPAAQASRPLSSDDLKLFAATFLGGFIFVSVYLA